MSKNPEQSRIGEKVEISTTGERAHAYVPRALPPMPPIQMEMLYPALERANFAISLLESAAFFQPNTSLFSYLLIRKEALLSLQIGGTQPLLSEFLLFKSEKTSNVPLGNIQEVFNYDAAIYQGINLIRDSFPISFRLIRDTHRLLLKKGRGSTKQPGEFRRVQNWSGGTRPGDADFVPPPPELIPDLLSDLEAFINDDTQKIPTLIMIGLVHVQFEMIHPFLDGNGRLGRLLITFLLCRQRVLSKPILYLSLYFKTHRQQYYKCFEGVHNHGDWEAWLEFFLEGITQASLHAIESVRDIVNLFEDDRHRIMSLGRPAALALNVHRLLQQNPIISISDVSHKLGKTRTTTIEKSIQHLQNIGILCEITGKYRSTIFLYDNYLSILDRGTESP